MAFDNDLQFGTPVPLLLNRSGFMMSSVLLQKDEEAEDDANEEKEQEEEEDDDKEKESESTSSKKPNKGSELKEVKLQKDKDGYWAEVKKLEMPLYFFPVLT
jgi:hypothetical protein